MLDVGCEWRVWQVLVVGLFTASYLISRGSMELGSLGYLLRPMELYSSRRAQPPAEYCQLMA